MPADSMAALLNGATAMACLGIALFFYRFWRESADQLFGCFSAAFVAFTVNYAILGALPDADERRAYAFIIRLVAFVVIFIGIVLKDRGLADHFIDAHD
ncbi:MAG TPA: DUF5985 family protein [Vicinamibacterales bacterium]